MSGRQRRIGPMPADGARASVVLFLLLTVSLDVVLFAVVGLAGRERLDRNWVLLLRMCFPALAGLTTRLIRRESFSDLGLRVGGWRSVRWILVACALPSVVGAAAYGAAWAFGLADLAPEPVGSVPGLTGLTLVPVYLLTNVPLGTLITLIPAAGEELGWRGTLLNRLLDARLPRPALLSGLIWATWHVPAVLVFDYGASSRPWVSVPSLVAVFTLLSLILARLQWRTGTVWVACFFHAAWNATILGVFDRCTDLTDDAALWVGESGLLVLAAVVPLAWWFGRGEWTIRRHPDDPEEPLPSTEGV